MKQGKVSGWGDKPPGQVEIGVPRPGPRLGKRLHAADIFRTPLPDEVPDDPQEKGGSITTTHQAWFRCAA